MTSRRHVLLPSLAALALLALSAPALADTAAPAAPAPAAKQAAKPDEKPLSPADVAKMKEDMFERGKRAYDRADWLKAIADLRPLTEMGDARAMILLGNMYASGNGVGTDHTEAFVLYHKAALAGSTDGMVAIAAMYGHGDGVGTNTRLSIGWFERAARLGDQTAAFFYGINLYQGSKGTTYDLKPDKIAAYRWFRIAATHGANKKMTYVAYRTAEKLAQDMPPDQVIDIEKEVKAWAPDTADSIGPNPEEKLAAEEAGKPKPDDKDAGAKDPGVKEKDGKDTDVKDKPAPDKPEPKADDKAPAAPVKP